MYWRGEYFGICGRNYEYADDDKCAMWKYAHEHGIPERVAENNLPDIAIQGEFCGAGIQKNRLKLKKPEWYVFTMIDLTTHQRYPLHRMQELCEKLQLKMLPLKIHIGEGKNPMPPKAKITKAMILHTVLNITRETGFKTVNARSIAIQLQCSTRPIFTCYENMDELKREFLYIDDLMSAFSTIRLHYVAADGSALLLRDAIDQMDENTFELYLKYHFATCERTDLAGVTSHAVDTFRKEKMVPGDLI